MRVVVQDAAGREILRRHDRFGPEELRAGLLLAVPEGIPAEEVVVELVATEPEAYAAEVCPELASHPAFAPLLERFGELRFAVFDFGGGTCDIACGRYRPATPEEEASSGCSAVIETLQVGGDEHLGVERAEDREACHRGWIGVSSVPGSP